MQVRNCGSAVIFQAAESIGAVPINFQTKTLRSGVQIHRFTIRPASPDCKFRRLSVYHPWSGKQRRVHAICWHGHRDFFRFLFQAAPEAIASTAWAKYTAENFESTFPETGYRNIGSQMYPMSAAEACDCPDAGECR